MAQRVSNTEKGLKAEDKQDQWLFKLVGDYFKAEGKCEHKQDGVSVFKFAGDLSIGPCTCPYVAPPSCNDGASCTVFTTSLTFTADLVSEAATLGLGDFTANGIGAGDAICNSLAQAASLPGAYKVWLSTSVALDPESRFVHASVPYVRSDGAAVALNWSDLTDGSLVSPLRVDETQTDIGDAGVWAGTNPLGMYDGLQHCSDWTSTQSTSEVEAARYGRSGVAADSRWTEWNRDNCSSPRRLYCFQQ